jgi:hypothetical protein
MARDIEAENQQILDEITKAIWPLDELVSVGPVARDPDDASVISCPVTVTDLDQVSVAAIENAGNSLSPSVKVTVGKGAKAVYAAPCPGETGNPLPPPNHPTPSEYFMGADACWRDSAPAEWGTIAFAAQSIRIRNGAGADISATNGCLSAGHVFGWQSVPGDLLSVPGHPHALSFVGLLPVINAVRPIDAALAKLVNTAQASLGAVRGFPQLQGVKAPATGMWIGKNSAKSGVTAGLDKGAINLPVGGILYQGVRMTTPGFACCHDSGAAVLSQKQEFVGLIFATDPLACDHRPSAYYIPARKFGAPSSPTVFDLEIDIQP